MIRPAEDRDRDAWLAIRNDPDALFWSGYQRPIREEDHRLWWETRIPSRYDRLLVSEVAGIVVGYARATPITYTEVSVGVTPSVRNHGIGQELVHAVEVNHSGARLLARVHPSNTASLALFRKSGFHFEEHPSFLRLWKSL